MREQLSKENSRVKRVERRRVKNLREEMWTKACIVGKRDSLDTWSEWETRDCWKDLKLRGCRNRGRLQPWWEETYESKGGRKVGRKGAMEKIPKVTIQRSHKWPVSPLRKGNKWNKWYFYRFQIRAQLKWRYVINIMISLWIVLFASLWCCWKFHLLNVCKRPSF